MGSADGALVIAGAAGLAARFFEAASLDAVHAFVLAVAEICAAHDFLLFVSLEKANGHGEAGVPEKCKKPRVTCGASFWR